ncbi:aldo/keto reductase [Nonomuraea angiospora]|uniref:aldo/keto reductase n=1 Tax=Nonomuraea angiospora TaxID=46172 RepID=UPI0033310199
MNKHTLGNGGPQVSALGLGCMGMSNFCVPGDEKESIAIIHRVLDLDMNFLDTADTYGLGANEEVVGRARAVPADAVVGTRYPDMSEIEG